MTSFTATRQTGRARGRCEGGDGFAGGLVAAVPGERPVQHRLRLHTVRGEAGEEALRAVDGGGELFRAGEQDELPQACLRNQRVRQSR